MLDILIAVALAIFTAIMGYMGLHMTMHPPSETHRFWYKLGFGSLTILGVVLVIWQGVRSGQSQSQLHSEITTARDEAKSSHSEMSRLRRELESVKGRFDSEVIRRQQAERDLGLIVQRSGLQTRMGVSEDFRKSPIKVDVTSGKEALKITAQFVRVSDSSPYISEYLVLTNQTVTPIRLLIACQADILSAQGRVMGTNAATGGG